MDTNNPYGQMSGDAVARQAVQALQAKRKRVQLITSILTVVALVVAMLMYTVVANSPQTSTPAEESTSQQ